MIDPTGAFDFWNLFVIGVFGSFWMTIIGLALVMFIIMGWLGRISIFSVTWFLVMFILCMTLGYGYTMLNVLVSLTVILAFIFSLIGYINRAGQ